MNNNIKAFIEAAKNIKTVGTVTFSSKFLVDKMIEAVDFNNAKFIVELGAGNGCITKGILEKMRPDAQLLSFEINEEFCNMIREFGDDRLVLVNESAENLEQWLDKLGVEQVDAVVCALPLVWLPDDLNERVLRMIKKRLKKGGVFTQLSYKSNTKNKFKHLFEDIDTRFTLFNLPPAYVFVSEQK